ncbi:unnamed protein product [Echinostoma caproni]|uniref:Neur_chan_LBD domain-containing protein n=1 Tax=Echinostoma caproni TaxID=27848 RepID=A0A183AZS6_9TREM|nr:unnamed protein product [Echinostoma caproni]
MHGWRQWFDPHRLIIAYPCDLMFNLVRTVILWILLTGGSVLVSTNENLLNRWIHVGHVANSIRPHLLISWSEYVGAGFHIELLRPETIYERCHIQTNLPESWTMQRKTFNRLYLLAPSPTTTSVNFTLEVVCNTSQGLAKLPIQLALMKSLQWSKHAPIPTFQINPIPDQQANSISFYRMHWRQKFAEEMIILIYNR